VDLFHLIHTMRDSIVLWLQTAPWLQYLLEDCPWTTIPWTLPLLLAAPMAVISTTSGQLCFKYLPQLFNMRSRHYDVSLGLPKNRIRDSFGELELRQVRLASGKYALPRYGRGEVRPT
jgi:hypothetical protein